MATVDEDLKTYLQASAPIARVVGTRVHENSVPMSPIRPFIFFVRTGDEGFDALDDAIGTAPSVYRFAVECVANNLKETLSLATLVKNVCHKATKVTFGSRTAQLLWCEDQSDSYEPRAGGGDTGFHVSSLQVEVIP